MSDLLVTARSDNPSLLPEGSVTVLGTGEDRQLRVAPAADRAGNANVTLTVTDAAGNARSVLFTKLTVRPSGPSAPRRRRMAPDQVELTWTDTSSNETSFKIDQSVSSDFRAFQTFSVPAGSTRYVASGLKANTRYYFRVRSAAAAAGTGATIESGSSAAVNADAGAGRLPHDANCAPPPVPPTSPARRPRSACSARTTAARRR